MPGIFKGALVQRMQDDTRIIGVVLDIANDWRAIVEWKLLVNYKLYDHKNEVVGIVQINEVSMPLLTEIQPV